MKDEVDPLPFVPAMWTGFRISKSDGYAGHEHFNCFMKLFANAHLISDSSCPLDHLGYGTFVPSWALLLDVFHDREVALERVECCDGGIVVTWTGLRVVHPMLCPEMSCAYLARSQYLHTESRERWWSLR